MQEGVDRDMLPNQYKYKTVTYFFAAKEQEEKSYIQMLDLQGIALSRKQSTSSSKASSQA